MIYILGFTFYFLLAMKVKTKSPNMNGGYSEAGIWYVLKILKM